MRSNRADTHNRRHITMACIVALVLATSHLHGQREPVADTLAKAGAYVERFERELGGVVAEEDYVQDFSTTSLDLRTPGALTPVAHRELTSDTLLIHTINGAHFVQFRDVFEVDGKPVRDRQERLTKLFLDASPSAIDQLRAIVAESARFNIGSIERTLNTPTLAMIFILPVNQHGSVFTATNDTAPALARASGGADASAFSDMPADMTVVSYEEGKRNTLIRGAGNKDLPSEGRFWIERTTGAVVMTELVAEDSLTRAVIDVRYRQDADLDFMVPSDMRERYEGLRNGAIVEGRATYSRFRRFQVDVNTTIPPPK